MGCARKLMRDSGSDRVGRGVTAGQGALSYENRITAKFLKGHTPLQCKHGP